ncbi:MAG: class I SAM-dependent methyltransferase [Solibacillus sp.]|uniref:class I SAM-dependent methyltransferase n=1 Tax=unclassified Solibacillus TaxID=2637870 RepID=UPI0030FD090F
MRQNIYDNDEFFKKYEAIRARNYNYNNLLEQPGFRANLPDLHGKSVLDIGCGSGDFAAFCLTKGAKNVYGIDISQNMIALANEKYNDIRLNFQQIAFEDAISLAESMDFISSSLAFHYMADFGTVIQKISRALRMEGDLLFSIEHPIMTANKGNADWVEDEEGQLLHYAVDQYQVEGARTQNWLVEDVVMYHRTLSTIINTLIENGLQIEKIIEPLPSKDAVQKLPSLVKQFRAPSFLIIRAKKVK